MNIEPTFTITQYDIPLKRHTFALNLFVPDVNGNVDASTAIELTEEHAIFELGKKCAELASTKATLSFHQNDWEVRREVIIMDPNHLPSTTYEVTAFPSPPPTLTSLAMNIWYDVVQFGRLFKQEVDRVTSL